MTQDERCLCMLRELRRENGVFAGYDIPENASERRTLLRAMVNVRPAAPVSPDFLSAQNDFLREELAEATVTDADSLKSAEPGIYLWQGDITRLRCGAIVNAANSGMTGCYVPGHNCIDNIIHTRAGVQLRQYCAELMERQGYEEPTGQAKLTPAFNLPCRYILHTVGPIVRGAVTEEHVRQLSSCYTSCLQLAEEHNIESIAFCCISTGVFCFPHELAAQTAVAVVRRWRESTGSSMHIIFNVFRDEDRLIYEHLLGIGKR